MKAISLKNLCATTSLLVGLGVMSSAQADTFAANLAMNSASATDVYGLTCPVASATTSIQANVGDPVADGIFVSVQVVDPRGNATRATAPEGGNSGPVVLGVGAGTYLVLVNKGQTGAENYQLVLDCYAGGAAVAGIQSALVQNQ